MITTERADAPVAPGRRPERQAPLRVVLVCPTATAQEARRSLARTEPGIAVVAEVPELAMATEAALGAAADIVVLDLAVVTDAVELGFARQLLIWPGMPAVLVLAGSADSAWLSDLPTDLATVHRRSQASGDLPALVREAAAVHRERTTPRPVAHPRPVALTPQEREVLALAARGLSNRAMAAVLSVSLTTVKIHIAAVLRKVGAHRKADLVSHASA